ncbi:hypothetical protein [Solidesulfovibrio sp.]
MTGFVVVLAFWITLFLACPGGAAAEDFDSMMPEQLAAELRRAESEYRKVMEELRATENERLARKATSESDAELHRLLGKAEKLKIEADYIKELYETKRREYGN